MRCLELLLAKRDGGEAHVHEIEERLPADTFDHLSDLVARLEPPAQHFAASRRPTREVGKRWRPRLILFDRRLCQPS